MDDFMYEVKELMHSGNSFSLFKSVHNTAEETIVVKKSNDKAINPALAKRLTTELGILQKFNHPGIIGVVTQVAVNSENVIVRKYAEGITVKEYTPKGGITIPVFFDIAMQLTAAVKEVHSKNIIHKNISPSNIIINPATGHITLIGFGLAVERGREAVMASLHEAFEADMQYISPEQTGRIGRTVDFRTDLYSLGAVMYFLLTGQPPFTGTDALELIHAHVAFTPLPVKNVRAEIPVVLSNIISKLLYKNEEARYQSAGGLLFDLQEAYQLYQSSSQQTFPLGLQDVSEKLTIPAKLYGREAELLQLQQVFDNIQNGGAGMVMVNGYSGVGKSSLIRQLQQAAVQKKGYFITGKFDQFEKDVPLSALITSLKQLIRQLLSEPDQTIAAWSSKITAAVGNTGQIIIDIIPEIKLLIGDQPALPELGALEARNRFNQTFNAFIAVFCSAEHPLYIFLDDLQWIDSATRQWLEDITINKPFNYFLVTGAYRSNEVDASHPLAMMMERVAQAEVTIPSITLQPLTGEDLNRLVADTLFMPAVNCADIAAIIYKKTNGNPFFTRQCLLSLYENNAIFFNSNRQAWDYDVGLVQKVRISDNVVELMAGLIARLPVAVQDTLKVAACTGNVFNTQLLATVTGLDTAAIHNQLAIAIQQGVIIPVQGWDGAGEEEYTFLHDRVQQAALLLLTDAEKKELRLKAGLALLKNSPALDKDSHIYEIADHLNYADATLAEQEAVQWVHANYWAALKAKNASAYETALRYITQAIQLLAGKNIVAEDAWRRNIWVLRADVEHMCGNNELAENYYNEALQFAGDVYEKAMVQQRKIQFFINAGRFNDAYNTGRETVATLGVKLPAKFVPPLLVRDLVKHKILLGRRRIADIAKLPEMTDERIKTAVLLMSTFARAAYQIRPELCIAVCTTIVNLCLQYGNTAGGYTGFIAFGPIFFGAILNKKQTGFAYGQLALELVERYKSIAFKAEIYFVAGYFSIPWKLPAIEMERYWQIAYEAGLESGDLFHASCACCATLQSYYMRGKKLEEVMAASVQFGSFLERIDNREGVLTLNAVTYAIRRLQGEDVVTDGDEAAYSDLLKTFGLRHFAHYYFINKMQTFYLWGDIDKAYEVSLESDKYLKDSPGMLHTAEHYFYKALILCALLDKRPNGTYKAQAKKISRRLLKYAAMCPANFIDKAQLLAAEIHRADNDTAGAEKMYTAAIASAETYSHPHIQALAHELAGRFNSNQNRTMLAGMHITEALALYRAWGAKGYARFLPEKYTWYNKGSQVAGNINPAAPLQQENDTDIRLDLKTVLKSAETISKEIRLRDLLLSMMNIIMENAGAQRIVLLLMQDGGLVVQSELTAENTGPGTINNIPLSQYQGIPKLIALHVARTSQLVLLDDAAASEEFGTDVYIRTNNVCSVVCAPLVKQGELKGIIYLENNLIKAAFTPNRVELLVLLSGQMAVSIENAQLYDNLEEKVVRRTEELRHKNDELQLTLERLKDSQRRLIHAEKMASLGQMATGIAHEIQNPLNFVNNFAEISAELVPELKSLVTELDTDTNSATYQDVQAILDDLASNLQKISSHGGRASGIVKGIISQTSGLSEPFQETPVKMIVDQGVEQGRRNFIKKAPGFAVTFNIEVDDTIGNINCLPKSLVSVVANLVDNSMYALFDKYARAGDGFTPVIAVKAKDGSNEVSLQVNDNGNGIPNNIIDKIFVPFFTTKPTGQGNTGNGLSQCHQVIAGGHNGTIEVETAVGEFTTFTIKLPKTTSVLP